MLTLSMDIAYLDHYLLVVSEFHDGNFASLTIAGSKGFALKAQVVCGECICSIRVLTKVDTYFQFEG